MLVSSRMIPPEDQNFPAGAIRPMRLCTLALLICSVTPLHAQTSNIQTSLPSLSDPALSPDGKEIAFASGGDIWTVPAVGGEAHLLISDPASESRPLYSPDGTRLAFISTRTGLGNIYVLTFTTGQLQRITFSDSTDNLDAWSRDGQWLYFTSSTTDVAGQGDILRVRSTGGTPLEVSRERYLNEFQSAPSPDGTQIALIAKGISSGQWWRNGHAHIDETEVWLKPVAGNGGYKRLLSASSKHAFPMWSPDGKELFFMSDHPGAENIYRADIATGKPTQLTHFTNGRVLWPTIAYDGKAIVFERHFSIWKMDTASGKAEQVKIALRGAPNSPGTTHTPLTQWSGLTLSPDGKKIALTAHGEVFAASAKDGGEPQRITRTDSAESDPDWSPDSTKLVYRSERDGGSSLYEYDFNSSSERALTHSTNLDINPTWSPDGTMVAFLRNRRELHVLTIAGLKDNVVAKGELNSSALAWSPDSKWLAFVPVDTNSFANLHVVLAAGGEDHPITFLANGETATSIAWSPDGKYILFDTSQRSETPQMARVDLILHVPAFREDQFRDLFQKQAIPGSPAIPAKPDTKDPSPATPVVPANDAKADTPTNSEKSDAKSDAKPAAKKKPEPVNIVFEGIHERLTLLPLGLGANAPVISPDGKVLLFSSEVAGQDALYTYSLDELSREPAIARQLTSTPGSKTNYSFSPDSKEVVYLESSSPNASSVHTITIESRTPKTIALSAAIDVDFDHEKEVVFDEAWNTLNHRFFDEKFNGHDWSALRSEWQPYIAGARTPVELRRDINLLIGELNSSHSGINRAAMPAVRVGRLGLRYEREPFEAGKGLIVREVVPLGPASLATSIHPGDQILSVNGTAIEASTNLDSLLEDQAGKRTVLSVAPAGEVSKKHDVILRPITLQVESGLLYRAWVADRRAYVEKISGGKLGYVHIAAMGDADLNQLYLDLDAQNQGRKGVVIDIRNNNGGYVNGRVIDVFARHNYLMMTQRDAAAAMPSRQALGQRALGLPTVLVTNESTLSDGEDFTEGYRTLQLGKVVGTPTAGWIIFTGAQRLIDGSQVRVPGYRIRDTRGEDMEMHPRPVDVEVERPLGETESGQDIQLERAVQTLLGSTGQAAPK
jgi:tricorn protease